MGQLQLWGSGLPRFLFRSENMLESDKWWFSKNIRSERTTASQVVANTVSWIYSIVIVSDGVGAADAAIHNGSNATAPLMLDLRVANNEMVQLNFAPPLFTDRGIFVAHGSNVKSVIVRYSDVRE